MNKFLERKLKEIISQLIEDEDVDPIEEDNTTGSGEAYLTPKAFSKNGKTRPVKDKTYPIKLKEISYSDFKNDPDKSPKEKINGNIREINRRLIEVEQLMQHAKKLKSETEDDNVYWKGTVGEFAKISERMNRISNRIKEMWA